MLFETDYPMIHLGDEPGGRAFVRRVRLLSFDGNKYVKVRIVSPGKKGHGDIVQIKAGYLRVRWANGRRDERTLARGFGKFLAAHQIRPECDPVYMHYWADGRDVHYDCRACKGVGDVLRPSVTRGVWNAYRCMACNGSGCDTGEIMTGFKDLESGDVLTFAEIQARHGLAHRPESEG